MPDYPKITSAGQLREELASLIRRYVQHLDWDAPTELTVVRIEASGPGLGLVYAETHNAPPRLQVSSGDWTSSHV